MTNLGTLRVRFNYKGIERPKTTAIVTNANGDIIAKVSVKKSRGDKSNKVVGRFWAFKKAMNQAALENTATKQQRTEAWAAFKTSCKVPTFLIQG
jgi:hypothetical protein